jgi:hypothetical protein
MLTPRRLLIVKGRLITSMLGLTPTSMKVLSWKVTGQCQSM